MNVAQLIEALSDYGDHLPVVVEIDKGEVSTYRPVDDIDHSERNGEPTVVITVSL